MAEELQALHSLAASMLTQLEGPARKKLMRDMAGMIRRANQRTMAGQRAPDGSPWPKRKQRKERRAATRPVRFLYRSGGQLRLVDMRSWMKRGKYLTGYDREAEGIRTFHEDRVVDWLPPKGSAEGGAARSLKGSVRRRSPQMFRSLRSSRYLKTGHDEQSGWIEFTERASRLAQTHHYGLRDRVAPGGPEIDYPERALLGFNPQIEADILNRFIDHAGDALGWGRRAR